MLGIFRPPRRRRGRSLRDLRRHCVLRRDEWAARFALFVRQEHRRHPDIVSAAALFGWILTIEHCLRCSRSDFSDLYRSMMLLLIVNCFASGRDVIDSTTATLIVVPLIAGSADARGVDLCISVSWSFSI